VNINSSPQHKFIPQGIKLGIIVAIVGSLFFSLILLVYLSISNPLSDIDTGFLASTGSPVAISALMILMALLIPAISAGIILSTWTYLDVKNERFLEKKTIVKGASLGFAFSMEVFAFVMWISMSYPPHGVLPTGGVITLILNYADIGILGISYATLAGAWAGKKFTKFTQDNITSL
jgi:hypothetical protein